MQNTIVMRYTIEGDPRGYQAQMKVDDSAPIYRRIAALVRTITHCEGHTLCRAEKLSGTPDEFGEVEMHFTNRRAEPETPERRKVVVRYVVLKDPPS